MIGVQSPVIIFLNCVYYTPVEMVQQLPYVDGKHGILSIDERLVVE